MLKVWVSSKIAGGIDHDQNSHFDFDFAYTQQATVQEEVSLTMPVSLASYPYKNGLHPIFQMNLPEGELRTSIERQFRKQAVNYDDLSLLEIVGRSQIGRLRFVNDQSLIDEMPQQSVQELIAYDGSADLLRDLIDRFSSYSGISGVQPKVLIRDTDFSKTSKDNARVTYKGATHIVKASDSAQYPHLAANEYFCMQAAAEAGLEVPSVSLSNNNELLIVERFDLGPDGNYYGFEDFCVLSGLDTRFKYDKSCEHMTKLINAYISPEHRSSAMEKLFRTLALSSVLHNGDAHLKNFGVLYETTGSAVKLSPAYDIVTTTPYIKNDTFALTLEGSKRFPDAKKLIRFGKLNCNLQPARSNQILEEIAEAVLKTISKIQTHIKDHPEFEKIGNAMIDTWHDGISKSCREATKKTQDFGR